MIYIMDIKIKNGGRGEHQNISIALFKGVYTHRRCYEIFQQDFLISYSLYEAYIRPLGLLSYKLTYFFSLLKLFYISF